MVTLCLKRIVSKFMFFFPLDKPDERIGVCVYFITDTKVFLEQNHVRINNSSLCVCKWIFS